MKELYLPEGRKSNQPLVVVRRSVIEKLGEPQVNYDQLNELFRRDLAVDQSIVPTVKLYGRRPTKHLGFHVPYSHTIHVHAVSAEHMKLSQQDSETPVNTMQVVIHEGSHLADSVNHRGRTAAEVALRVGSIEAGYLVGDIIGSYPEPIDTLSAFGYSLLFGMAYQWTLAPEEKRARAVADTPEIYHKYKDAITFPLFERKNK